MKTTWETASAPTSVMSETTKKKLSDIIVPYNSFDVTNNMLRDFCKEGKASAVRFLLLKGCNPGTKKRPRSAPLLVAIQGASERHNKCVRELIKYDVDVNVRKKGSRNPALHLAIENAGSDSYVKLIWLLVNAGANLDSLDSNGDTALTKLFSGEDSWPLERHRLEALALLLQGGVQVNYQAPGTGNTPLHLAVRRKDKWAVAMLLYQGADVNAKNYAGSTPLQVTANQFRGDLSPDHAQVLDLLLQADASIDEPAGALRRTALHNAVASNTAYAVRLLLQYGADPKLVDNEGRDAMQLAIQ
ncbi:ankyrin repeat-containing domain protein, partial [Coniella lustricola]